VKIRRFSGHPQVRDWAIIPFQGEYQVPTGTGNWTMSIQSYATKYDSHSVTGNRSRISTRAGSLLSLHSSGVYFSFSACSPLSIILRCWYLMIVRVPDLCSPCQIPFISILFRSSSHPRAKPAATDGANYASPYSTR
jgi:hypothetical protein